jgi:hypothetical protein
MYVCAHLGNVDAHRHVCTHMHVYACMRMCVSLHVFMHMHVYMCACVCICCAHRCVFVCMCTSILLSYFILTMYVQMLAGTWGCRWPCAQLVGRHTDVFRSNCCYFSLRTTDPMTHSSRRNSYKAS